MTDSYLKRLLAEREQIHLIAHQHWLILLRNLIPEIALIILTIILTIVWMGMLPNPAFLWFLGLIILPVVSMIRDVLVWRSHMYIITSRRVIQLIGVVNKNVIDSSLEKVNDVKMEQNVMGRMFNYGDVEILTASEMGVNRFAMLGNPVLFKTTMLNAKGLLENGDRIRPVTAEEKAAYAPQSAGGRAEVLDLLTRLGELKERGVLTEAEFQTKKNDLLSRL